MNITDKQMSAIEEVMSILSSEINHRLYDPEDISQEVFLICSSLLNEYNEEKGELFPYLLGAARNRLVSFFRKHVHNPATNNSDQKMALVNSLTNFEMEMIDEQVELHNIEYDVYIDENIPSELREDYLRLKEGIKISSQVKNKILDFIKISIGVLNGEENV